MATSRMEFLCTIRNESVNHTSHKHSEEWNMGRHSDELWQEHDDAGGRGGGLGTGIKVSASALRNLLPYWL